MNGQLDLLPCGYLSFGENGVVEAVNTSLLELLGLEREQVEQQHFQEILSVGGRVFYQTHLFPLLKLQGHFDEIYLTLCGKDGRQIPVLVNARKREHATPAVFDCVLMHMRQRNDYEEQLLTAQRTAQRANDAKDQFLAALSHELRTPLSPVLMLSTVMELDPLLTPEVREQAAIIRRNTELEARLIDDLLDLTRIAKGKLKLVLSSVDLHTLLSHSEEIVKSESLGKRVKIEVLREAANPFVEGDSARLQQVFWNIIKNAVKFTPSGGLVRVQTTIPAPGKIAIAVTDTGIGIRPENLQVIFNAFEQASVSTQRFGGLGLGLAITKAIVEMHHGTIEARSEGEGRGTTFIVEFPTVAAPAMDPKKPASWLSSTSRKLNLLVVEDHQSTREVLSRILERSGHSVFQAGTGADALRLAESNPQIDLVISDIGLPDQSGLELMQILKEKHQLRGIALSGYGMDDDVQKAKAAGFCGHLVKPVSYEQLCSVLEQVASGELG